MKELEANFMGKGEMKDWLFSQVEKSDKAYIYVLSLTVEHDVIMYYDVFERKEQQAKTSVFMGKEIYFEAKVLYPNTKDYGAWAWCFHFSQIEKARAKFDELTNK